MASRKALRQAQEQAALSAFIQTNPEASALAAAIRGKRSEFISTARSAKGAARGIEALAMAARPRVAHGFDEAQDTRVSAQRVLDAHLGGLNPAVAGDYIAASARENAGFRTRIGESRAHELSDLDARMANARAGALYAETAARSKYQSDKGELQRRQRELGRESGAIQARELNSALEQESKDAQARRAYRLQAKALDETTRHNKETESTAQQNADTAAGKGRTDRKNKGHLSTDAKRQAKGYVGYARGYAREAKKLGLGRHQVADRLLGGRELGVDYKVKDKRTGKVTEKHKQIVPGRQLYDELFASVALDLEFDGHVSQANRNRLRKLGVSAARSGWAVGRTVKAGPRPPRNKNERPT